MTFPVVKLELRLPNFSFYASDGKIHKIEF